MFFIIIFYRYNCFLLGKLLVLINDCGLVIRAIVNVIITM